MSILTPELITHKLAYVRSQRNPELSKQFEMEPRLAEIFWFIESRARRPRSQDGFFQDFISFVGEKVMPTEFLDINCDGDLRYSPEDVFLVWDRLPQKPCPSGEMLDFINLIKACKITDLHSARESGVTQKQVDSFRDWLTRDLCVKTCARHATIRLPQSLIDCVSDPDALFPESLPRWVGNETFKRGRAWHLLPDLVASLLAWMDQYARLTLSQIAQTRVTGMAEDALDYASRFKALVLLLGDSRYGKTESLITLAEAYAGKWRAVRTPANGGMTDLLLAIAESAGFEIGAGLTTQLKARLKYFLKNSGLGFIFDESQYLVPANFSATTAPARLNFVRAEIVDANIPCVLAATPQSHKQTIKSFTKKTQYAMEQWLGRVDQTFICPVDFTKEDMLAVAKLRLPGISEKSLRLIIARAMQSEQFLHAMTAIARRAKWLAQDGEPTQAQIDQASDEFINGIRCTPADDHPAPKKVRGAREERPIDPAPARQIFPSRNISEEMVSHV